MVKKFVLLASVALAAFFFAIPPAASQENEHEQRQSSSPCGQDKLLDGLTGFFKYRWQAQFVDLGPGPTQRFLEHNNLSDAEIALVRVFYSPHQRTVAVVTARRFTNYLAGNPLVAVLCIVPALGGGLTWQYGPRELEAIIAVPGHDT